MATATSKSSSGSSSENEGDKNAIFMLIPKQNAVIKGLSCSEGFTFKSVHAQKLHRIHALYSKVANIQKKNRIAKLTEYVLPKNSSF